MINWGSEYFESKNISESRLNIELILSHVLNCDRIKLYLDYEKPLTIIELSDIKEMVRRRIKREPLQYIIGRTQFLKHKILLNKSVLIPRPETEFLVELIIRKFSKTDYLKILEIGTGSGCISIALGNYFKNSEITAIDISNEALEIAKQNAFYNEIKNISFAKMDILEETPTTKFDLIVSNPPYISEDEYLLCEPEVKYYEPKNALSDFGDGYKFYTRYSNIFNDLLNDNGSFFLEIAYNQSEDLQKIFQTNYITDTYKDFAGLPRYIIGRKIKNN